METEKGLSTLEKNILASMQARIAALEGVIRELVREVRELRGLHPGTGELLAALHGVFEGNEFTSAWALESCLEAGGESVRLRQAIKVCIGKRPTIQKISRFLTRSVGTCGLWYLACSQEHSKDGRLFKISKVTNLLTTPSGRSDRLPK